MRVIKIIGHWLNELFLRWKFCRINNWKKENSNGKMQKNGKANITLRLTRSEIKWRCKSSKKSWSRDEEERIFEQRVLGMKRNYNPNCNTIKYHAIDIVTWAIQIESITGWRYLSLKTHLLVEVKVSELKNWIQVSNL